MIRREGTAALGLAAVLALAAGIGWLPPEHAGDLRPRADALEYEETARNLAEGKGYWLFVAGEQYPPQHSFGFPLLLAPVLYFGDETPGAGVLVVLACALVTVAATWSLARTAGGPVAALAAALIVALSPLHVRSSQMVMSDVPAAAAMTVLAAWMVRLLGRPSRAPDWILLGAGMGLAATIRLPCVFVLIPAAASLLLNGAGRRHLFALGAGALLGLLPLFAYDLSVFGSPLRTGFDYWWPRTPFFGLDFALRAPHGGGSEPNLLAYARTLAGGGGFYSWPIAVLALAGTVAGLRLPGAPRTVVVFALVSVLVTVVFHGVYFWQAERFILPALPLCATMAALPLAGRGRARWAAVGLATLALIILTRAPEPFGPPHKVFHEPATLRAIDRAVEPNAVILVRTNAYFFERLLRRNGADRIWVPLGLCDRRFTILWNGIRPYAQRGDGRWMVDVFGEWNEAQTEAALRALLADGRPVYLSRLLAFQVPFLGNLQQLLTTRFALEDVHGVGPWPLFRVRPARAQAPT
jgi:4-amino-4-deoxy-L-arabinose transferase-like glycosyltransferase